MGQSLGSGRGKFGTFGLLNNWKSGGGESRRLGWSCGDEHEWRLTLQRRRLPYGGKDGS